MKKVGFLALMFFGSVIGGLDKRDDKQRAVILQESLNVRIENFEKNSRRAINHMEKKQRMQLTKSLSDQLNNDRFSSESFGLGFKLLVHLLELWASSDLVQSRL